jgi:glycosyltransferase involved in cell wall biosynthesis
MVLHQIVINFSCDTYSGWGAVGLNWMAQLQADPDWQPLFGVLPQTSQFMGMDPLRFSVIDRAIQKSKQFQYDGNCIWVDPIGNDVKAPSEVDPKCLVGRAIIEKADMRLAMENLSRYDLLLTGSTWNQERLEAATGRTVKVIHEGVDPSIFCPGPKSGWFDTFNIFSSGKVEYRKAQDVTLMAFKRFSERHADARLITLWNSPYSDLGNGYQGIAEAPLWLNQHGHLDVKRWAKDNGIDPDKVLDLKPLPNWMLPPILRDMDVMLAPTRVESCTSLPVKEAMACGVPVIYARHSGMLDLPETLGLPLLNNKPISASSEYFFPQADWTWYEPDLDEIDSWLEFVYKDRESAKKSAEESGAWIRENRNWSNHVNELKIWLKGAM